MTVKKLICALLCLLMLSLAGCRENNTESSSSALPPVIQTAAKNSIELLFCYSDTFNPYTATTDINRTLCKLMFDPLIKLDNSFEPVYCLASSAQMSGNTCTVTLKNAVFSDGSAISASDVVYSYNLAKASTTAYASQLYEVSSAVARDNLTVVFNLTRNDPYFINLLDFPIIKSGSDKITDADGVIQPPIGSGRYIPSADRRTLIQNSKYHGSKGEITEIKLTDAPDADSVSHYVEVGTADLYYTDLADGNIVRMSGKKADINLNHLVFIGINDAYEPLSSKDIRYAISSALDRKAIVQSAFYNNALPATGFFSPAFEEVKSVQTLSETSNLEIALENLGRIGYNSKSAEGYMVNSSGKYPSFTLLVNKENHSRLLAANLIAKQLKAAGIDIRVIEKSYADYTAALSSGNFQLYLGEVKLLNNMDMSGLVIPGGSAAYGVGANAVADGTEAPADDTSAEEAEQTPTALSCKDMIDGFYAGNKTVTDVAGTLLTEMPQIPVCYRLGLLFYSSDIENGVEASVSDIYFSIERYTFKK